VSRFRTLSKKDSGKKESGQQGRGNLFIIAAPSGGGKTSLVNALLAADKRLALSVSHTTRSARKGEEDGVQYHFVNLDMFKKLVNEGAFLEHANVFGNHYGTHAGALELQLGKGLDVILEIDWQGAAQVRKIFPECCSIYIVPPSYDVLQQRLSRRATDSKEVIDRRMHEAQAEISHWNEFDYLVVNEKFEEALLEIRNIMQCTRSGKYIQQNQPKRLLAELLGSR
jgi:guanylate kinase